MLFVFAYIDLFSLYRPDFRADVEAGEVAGFAVNQTFLLGTTAYVVIPSLMVFAVLVMRPRLNRILNIALAPFMWSASSPQPSVSGATTSWAASSSHPCSRPSSSTHGPGRRRSARPDESTNAPVKLGKRHTKRTFSKRVDLPDVAPTPSSLLARSVAPIGSCAA
jgi:hypothetical protein